jgi:hypothetical protein
MDRSLLSHKEVINASREFVCVRTATYEDKDEEKFLHMVFVRGAGTLRNFGYCILSPDGTKQLKRSNGGPNFVYANAAAMAKDLRRLSKPYRVKPSASKSLPALPQLKSVRLGVNVASCDGLPGVIAVGTDRKDVERLKKKLSAVAWDKELIGKFIYSSTSNLKDVKIISGAKSKTGILVFAPSEYGLKGTMITAISSDVSTSDLKKALILAAKNFTRRSRSHGSHVQYGRRTGKNWKTEVPVPDRASRRSRSRRGGRRNQR